MKNLLKVTAVAGLLLIAVGCSSSKTATTSPTSAAGGSTTTTVAKSSSGSGDAAAFCSKLAAEADQTKAFAAAVGTPDQAAKLADLKAANADIAASAPDAIHDAVAKFYAISELADTALSSGTPAEKGRRRQGSRRRRQGPGGQDGHRRLHRVGHRQLRRPDDQDPQRRQVARPP